MSGRWNPDDPFTLGLQWDARDTVLEPVDFGIELGAYVVPTATVTVTGAAFHSPGPAPGGTDAEFTAWNLVTVYEEGSELGYGDVREAGSAVNIASTTGTLGGGAASALDALSSPSDAKYILLDALNEVVDVNFAFPDLLTSTPRILDVQFLVLATPVVTGSSMNFEYMPSTILLTQTDLDDARTYSVSTGEIFLAGYNYATFPTDARRRVWLEGDLTDLSDGTVDFRVRCLSNSQMRIQWIGMTVTYCEENRVASGGLIRTSADTNVPWVPGWQSGIELVDVNTEVAGFQAIAGRRYLVTMTRAADVSGDVGASGATIHRQIGEPRLLSTLTPVDPRIVDGRTARRLTTGLLVAAPVAVDRGAAIVLLNSSGVAVEALSQPYALAQSRAVSPVTQEVISPTFTAVCSHVNLTVRRFGAPGNLVVTVGASTATLPSADYDAADVDASGFARFTLPFDVPVTLTAGVERTVSALTSTGVDRWEIPVLSTAVTGSPYPQAGYGGTAQVGQSDVKLDYAITLSTAVPAATGIGTGRGFHPLAPADAGCPGPQAHSVDYASVCWSTIPIVSGSPAITGTPLVTGFCAWQVERRDFVDLNWRTIARITDQNIVCVDDYEARIGVASDYRVRLCRLDGACGDWAVATGFVRFGASDALSAPVTDGSWCGGLVLTANEAPDMTVAYPYGFEGTPEERFTFDEAGTVVFQRLHMRDYVVALRPLERSGSRFSRTLVVNALSVPPDRLDRGFDALRDLAWATLSYVAVLDDRGGRWFAAVGVPEGIVRESTQIYLASIDVVELTDRPSVIDVEAIS